MHVYIYISSRIRPSRASKRSSGTTAQPPLLPAPPALRSSGIIFFFFTVITGPRRSLSIKQSDTRVYEPQIRVSGINSKSINPWVPLGGVRGLPQIFEGYVTKLAPYKALQPIAWRQVDF